MEMVVDNAENNSEIKNNIENQEEEDDDDEMEDDNNITSQSISDLLLRNNEMYDDDDDENDQIWDVDVGSLLDGLLGPSPPPIFSGDSNNNNNNNNNNNEKYLEIKEEQLVEFICKILKNNGINGRLRGASLGQFLAKKNKIYYRVIKRRFGTLVKLLLKYPKNFKLENDAPYNHIVLICDDNIVSSSTIITTETTTTKLETNNSTTIVNNDKNNKVNVSSTNGMVTSKLSQGKKLIVDNVVNILNTAKNKKMKAVSLANKLIKIVGKKKLKFVKKKHGGLLKLLEEMEDMFKIIRFPKDDYVELIIGGNNYNNNNKDDSIVNNLVNNTDGYHKQPSTELPTKILHIPNIAASIGKAELLNIFEVFGKVEYVRIVIKHNNNSNSNNKNSKRRLGFVGFYSLEDAITCRKELVKQRKIFHNNLRYGKQVKGKKPQ